MSFCKCNCGTEVLKNWAPGHNRRGTTFKLSQETRQKIRASKLGALNPRFGKPGTRLGTRMSQCSRDKIRIARAKQVITLATRLKVSESLKRAYREGRKKVEDLAWYVDGRHKGKTPIKQSFEYRMWRTSVFQRDNYTCQHCGARGVELQADHIKPQATFPELRFELSNGRTLCRPCHINTPSWGQRVANRKQNTSNLLSAL